MKGVKGLRTVLVPAASGESLKLCRKCKRLCSLWWAPLKSHLLSCPPSQMSPCLGPLQSHPEAQLTGWNTHVHSTHTMLQLQTWGENLGPLPFQPILFSSEHPTYIQHMCYTFKIPFALTVNSISLSVTIRTDREHCVVWQNLRLEQLRAQLPPATHRQASTAKGMIVYGLSLDCI